ncbi:MAG: hypothetical protein AB1555_19710 [Nitrospirota bacterium]
MNRRHQCLLSGGLAALAVLGMAPLADAQTFNSGSTGSLGAFAPASNTVVTLPSDGILNYTTVSIPSGVVVTFQRNAANTPVTILAQGDVSIAGTIRLNGEDSVAGVSSGNWGPLAGRQGGPGGYNGGDAGLRGQTPTDGKGGQGPGGGSPGMLPAIFAGDGFYGPSGSFMTLIPLFGGSGGGGGAGSTSATGSPGGGGGGAVVIASNTQITIQSTGAITANGGAGYVSCTWGGGGAGSGGAVRLVAPQVTNLGSIQAVGGNPSCVGAHGGNNDGRVRIECTTCTTGTVSPAASVSSTLGPVALASTPPLVNLPMLTISAVGGTTVPASPSGSHATPDVSLPAGITNPVTVTLIANNVPVPTQFRVKIVPEWGEPQFFPTTWSTGSVVASTATAAVWLPPGHVYVLMASVDFYQVAAWLPTIEGEPVDRVMVAAEAGSPSSVSLVLRSGKQIPVAELSSAEQQQVALAFEQARSRTP